jgi:hypothetical protein
MEKNPRDNDRRRIQRRREFGYDTCCLLCGESDPISFHHNAGAANDAEMEGPVCANCHLKLHEDLRIAGIDLRRRPRTVVERIHAVLLGLAVFFRLLAERCAYWADRLAAFIRLLDRALPEWRHMREVWE